MWSFLNKIAKNSWCHFSNDPCTFLTPAKRRFIHRSLNSLTAPTLPPSAAKTDLFQFRDDISRHKGRRTGVTYSFKNAKLTYKRHSADLEVFTATERRNPPPEEPHKGAGKPDNFHSFTLNFSAGGVGLTTAGEGGLANMKMERPENELICISSSGSVGRFGGSNRTVAAQSLNWGKFDINRFLRNWWGVELGRGKT